MGLGVTTVGGLDKMRTGVTLNRGSRMDSLGTHLMVSQVGKALLKIEGVVLSARVMIIGRMSVQRGEVLGTGGL